MKFTTLTEVFKALLKLSHIRFDTNAAVKGSSESMMRWDYV